MTKGDRPAPARTRLTQFCVLPTAFFAFASPSVALGPIDTDGPNFVGSPEVVPTGHFQYELDLTSLSDSRSGSQSAMFSAPLLLKYGVGDVFELRVDSNGYTREDGSSGVGDTALGLKWHAQDRDASKNMPAICWIVNFETPSGSGQFRGIGVRPTLLSILTWDLPHDLSLGLMPGMVYDTDGSGRRFTSGTLGAVVYKQIDDRLHAFFELSAPRIARATYGGVSASADFGGTYLVNNDLQLGVRVGAALNRNTPNNYFLFEVAQRF
jgi:outer membrane putative beta-barrel porin/alpha-amylase